MLGSAEVSPIAPCISRGASATNRNDSPLCFSLIQPSIGGHQSTGRCGISQLVSSEPATWTIKMLDNSRIAIRQEQYSRSCPILALQRRRVDTASVPKRQMRDVAQPAHLPSALLEPPECQSCRAWLKPLSHDLLTTARRPLAVISGDARMVGCYQLR